MVEELYPLLPPRARQAAAVALAPARAVGAPGVTRKDGWSSGIRERRAARPPACRGRPSATARGAASGTIDGA